MLEEIHDFGPVNIAKFGSRNRTAVDNIFAVIRTAIERKRKQVSYY